jgi:hypothetical protein
METLIKNKFHKDRGHDIEEYYTLKKKRINRNISKGYL